MTTSNFGTVILTLAAQLSTAHVPFTVNKCFDGWQLRFPWCEGDVICHSGSYGHDDMCVESYQFSWDEGDVSVLTPDEAAERIIACYADYLLDG